MNPVQSTFTTPASNTKQLADAHRFFQQPYPSDFHPALDFLMKDASAVAVLEQIESNNEQQKEKISLRVISQKNQESYNYGSHTISIGSSFRQSPLQQQVALLFFELQNALQRQDYKHLYAQASTLGKEHFVEQIEAHEYHSALATHKYVQKCVSAGVFTKKTPYFIIPHSFKDNYHLQQLTGHAQNIATQFEAFHPTKIPYRGTWPQPLTEIQIPILKELICNKAILETEQETEEEKLNAEKEIKALLSEIDEIHQLDDSVEYCSDRRFLLENVREIFLNGKLERGPAISGVD